MASSYAEFAADERFRSVSGVCFNDRLEAMKPGDSEAESGLDQLRFAVGRDHYPSRAEDVELQARVWDPRTLSKSSDITYEPATEVLSVKVRVSTKLLFGVPPHQCCRRVCSHLEKLDVDLITGIS